MAPGREGVCIDCLGLSFLYFSGILMTYVSVKLNFENRIAGSDTASCRFANEIFRVAEQFPH
jgi:hypothetical protein